MSASECMRFVWQATVTAGSWLLRLGPRGSFARERLKVCWVAFAPRLLCLRNMCDLGTA